MPVLTQPNQIEQHLPVRVHPQNGQPMGGGVAQPVTFGLGADEVGKDASPRDHKDPVPAAHLDKCRAETPEVSAIALAAQSTAYLDDRVGGVCAHRSVPSSRSN